MSIKEESIIQLPDNGIVTTEWAAVQLERASLFSSFELNANKGRVFFMLKTHLGIEAYKQSVNDLDYEVSTADSYIRFLEKLPVLEAIKEKYYIAISLSASELIPEDIKEANALIDVCLARVGKPTQKNLLKTLKIVGTLPTRMSAAAITVEKDKKKALNDWLQSEHNLSDDDILEASRIKTEGKTEFIEKMIEAFDRLDDWKTIYSIIAKPIHDSGNTVALRFLSDINDASKSINSFLKSEKAHNELTAFKQEFEDKIYPELNFEKEQ